MNNISRTIVGVKASQSTKRICLPEPITRQPRLSGAATIGLLLVSGCLNAQTLSDAVNAQLATVSLPCDRLLAGDPTTVLTGNLAGICGRVVPFGSTPASTGGGSANTTSQTSNVLAVMQEAQKDSPSEDIATTQIGSKWTVFLTAEYGTLDRDVTAMEDGFDSDGARLIAGSSYAVSPSASIGFALTLQRQDGDYTNGGNFKDSSTGLRLLGSFYPSANSFVQAVAGYDSFSSERMRAASFTEYFNGGLVFSTSGNPYSDFDYRQTELAVLTGYNYIAGGYTITPQLGVTSLISDYGTYSESGSSGLELTFHDDKRKSLQSSLGVQIASTIGTSYGVMIPQLDLHWKYEFADESRQVNVSFVQDTRAKQFTYNTEAGDSSFFELSAGVAFVFSQGKQAFIRLQTLLGHDYYESYAATAGMNFEL